MIRTFLTSIKINEKNGITHIFSFSFFIIMLLYIIVLNFRVFSHIRRSSKMALSRNDKYCFDSIQKKYTKSYLKEEQFNKIKMIINLEIF